MWVNGRLAGSFERLGLIRLWLFRSGELATKVFCVIINRILVASTFTDIYEAIFGFQFFVIDTLQS